MTGRELDNASIQEDTLCFEWSGSTRPSHSDVAAHRQVTESVTSEFDEIDPIARKNRIREKAAHFTDQEFSRAASGRAELTHLLLS